jgi:hypothetical protein
LPLCPSAPSVIRYSIVVALTILVAATTALHSLADESTPTTAPATTTRFATLDVVLDPANRPLAAYQFDLRASHGNVKIVGIEGGDHPAYQDAPYYDPAAMMNDRVILAAYSTNNDLPKTKTRVARIHIQIEGPTQPEYTIELTTAAGSDGQPIEATVTIEEGPTP